MLLTTNPTGTCPIYPHITTKNQGASLLMTCPAVDLWPDSSPTGSSSFGNDPQQSSWFLIRILNKFTNAVMEQSEHLDSPNQRSSSMISYCVSPFAAMCMTTAISLNRIMVFASSRNGRSKLPFISHLLLRSLALYLLCNGAFGVLVAFKTNLTQDSNVILRFLLSSSRLDYDYDTFKEHTFLGLPYLSRSFLDFSHLHKNLDLLRKSPSPSILKPLYLSLCLSQILETFILLTNGNDPLIENGLTLFEYSLLFQEVQSASIPSVEVLVTALVALTNQIIIHLLGLFNLSKYRLIPSSLVGSFILSFCFFNILNDRLVYFPFIVIMGYLPQLLTSCIILLCITIFILLAVFKGSFTDLEFKKITDNIGSINVLMSDDFFTLLTNLGTFMLTAAGKASYVKEISEVNINQTTWLENAEFQPGRERSKSFISKITGYANYSAIPPELQELRDHSSETNQTSSRWILLKRVGIMKEMFRNLKQVLESLVSRKKPLFLELETDAEFVKGKDNGAGLRMEGQFEDEEEDDEDYEIGNEEDEEDEREEDVDDEREDDDEDDENLIVDSEDLNDTSVLQELISSPEDLLSLVTLEFTQQQSANDLKILKAHLSRDKIVTRSHFNKLQTSNPNLLDLILEKRRNMHQHEDGSDEEEVVFPECVICQTNPREIILWPCKCLAICESCRVSLIVRGFDDCVCCRRKVELYSKVYVP